MMLENIEETYQKKTLIEHILHRPDSYVGSINKSMKSQWIFDKSQSKIIEKEILFVPALFKIFDEILVNASDNKHRDDRMSYIKVNVNEMENEISISNDGSGIPVVLHSTEKMYIPTLIFGSLLTSSNYDDSINKYTGGRNGFGAKLCNMFSTMFSVETSSAITGYRFKQTWTNNMKQFTEPVIEKAVGPDFTTITFKPDLTKFQIENLNSDIVALFQRRVYDIASHLKNVSVYFNDTQIPIKSFKQYVELYDNKDSQFIHYKINDSLEVAVTLSPSYSFTQISFVNGINTVNGGLHVNTFITKLIQSITHKFELIMKEEAEQIRPNLIKNSLWIFVNSVISNPCFESQSKEYLSSLPNKFSSQIILPDKFINNIIDCGLLERVQSMINVKKDSYKTLRKVNRISDIIKLDDAIYAGTKLSGKCTLILTEGNSAKSFALSGLDILGKDYYGVYSLQGKILNTRNVIDRRMLLNRQYKDLVNILGIRYKHKYSTKESLKSLRYGKLMIMTDQDPDGSHIKGLILNFFHYNWPEILQLDFFEQFITPLLKGFKDNQCISFFSFNEYRNWINATPDYRKWRIKYYKGLGTSTSAEAKEYFRNIDQHRKSFYYSGLEDDFLMKLVFERKQSKERKDWILKWSKQHKEQLKNNIFEETALTENIKSISYKDFFNKEFIIYSNQDNERGIPSIMDGLKPSQRKIIYTCLKRNFIKDIKVSQLSGSVTELTNYYHSENSLYETIINLAQDYVGSNNINLLMPAGQFGTRVYGGKDSASARYISTKLSSIVKFIFQAADDNLLAYTNDENRIVEPTWYAPIIPLVLINGASGIGTGWKTFIPNYNPFEIIENLRLLLNDKPAFHMIPWYRNFKGSIKELDRYIYETTGQYRILDSKTLEIFELPIGMSTQKYKEYIINEMLVNSKNIVKDFEDHNTDVEVRFIIHLNIDMQKSQINLDKLLNLTVVYSTKSMVLFDENGEIKKYKTPEDILMEFFRVRLIIYEKRKDHYIQKILAEAKKFENQLRFIIEAGKLNLQNFNEHETNLLLKQNNFDSDPVRILDQKLTKERKIFEDPNKNNEFAEDHGFEYLLNMPLKSFTKDKMEYLNNLFKSKLSEAEIINRKSPREIWLDELQILEDKINNLYARDNF